MRGCDQRLSNGGFGRVGDDCTRAKVGMNHGALVNGSVTIEQSVAAEMLADGELTVRFHLNKKMKDIAQMNRYVMRDGVEFSTTKLFSFAVGGSVNYEAAEVSALSLSVPAVPLPASGLLLGVLGGGAVLRRRRKAS